MRCIIFMKIMIFIWGTRLTHHRIGHVAEHCPSCQQTTHCRLFELSRGSHIYFIPTGKGKFALGHEARCSSCRHPFQVNASYYHTISRRKKELRELIPLTSPWLGPFTEQQIQQEKRRRIILDMFLRYDASLRERSVRGGTHLDAISVLGLLAAFLLPVLFIWLTFSGHLDFLNKSQRAMSALLASVTAFVWGFYLFASEDRRFFRRNTLPRLLSETAPMQLQKQDWEMVVARMKKLRFPSWRMLKPEIRKLNGDGSHPLLASPLPIQSAHKMRTPLTLQFAPSSGGGGSELRTGGN